jgi:sugar phosphate isomerase/epimerase
MSQEAKICRGSWCPAFGLDPMPSLEQTLKVYSAFGYDGIEVGGFFDHATLERYPDSASRAELRDEIASYDLEVAGYAPGPYGDFGRFAWATGDEEALAGYKQYFEDSLQLAADIGSPSMRIDPGDFGPLAREADYQAAWDRVVSTFQEHARRGREEGILMLWEYETGQIFTKPSEVVALLEAVGDDNLKLIYDSGHFQAGAVLAHNQVQPVEKLEGGQVEFIEMLKGHLGHIHLCDNDNETYENLFGTHLGFGKGVVDFDAVVPAILDAGYDGKWWAVDSIPMSSDAWGDTWDGKFFLEDLLDKYVR